MTSGPLEMTDEKDYLFGMANALNTPAKTVRDPRTGRMVKVHGYGALKGQLHLAKGLDLTKPIYDQVAKPSRRITPKP